MKTSNPIIMKKLFLTSLVLLGVIALASCKKTVAPSAYSADSTPYKAVIYGSVVYNGSIPADGSITTVTAQLMNGSEAVAGWTFSTNPDAGGQYTLVIPMTKADADGSGKKYTVKAKVVPAGATVTYEGSQTIESVKVGDFKSVSQIKCTQK